MKHGYALLFLIATIITGFLLFAFVYDKAIRESIRNTNSTQHLHAVQAAEGIENFFDGWMRTLTALAGSEHVLQMDDEGKEIFELIYKANEKTVRTITRLDGEGRIAYTFPFNLKAIGTDISHQDHVREIMSTHKPVVSNVFSAVQGYDTVALHVPVFSKGAYKGTVAVGINFEALAKIYLKDIKIGNTGYAWMVSQDGTELYCPVPGHIGKSVFENCKDFPSILIMAKAMLEGRQGVAVYDFDKIRDEKVETVRKHAVYMPINIGNTFWSIVVATSENEIISFLEDFRKNLLMIIAFLLLCGVIFSYYGVKAWFILREEGKRRQVEDALRESESKLAGIIEFLPDATFVIDLEGKVIAWNRAIEEMTGVGKKDMLGQGDHAYTVPFYGERRKHLLDLIDADDKELESRYQNVQRKGSILHAEAFTPALYGGKGAYVFAAGASLFDIQGNRVGAIESIRDITDRRRAEAKLKEAYDIISKSPVVAFLWKNAPGWPVEFVTDNVEMLFGYKAGEFTSGEVPYSGTIHPDDLERVAGEVADFSRDKGGVAFDHEPYRIVTKDGKTKWVNDSTFIRRNEKGDITHYQGLLSDITDRRRTEEALIESEERYKTYVENSFAGVYVVQNGRFVFLNSNAASFAGYKPEDLIGRLSESIVHSEDLAVTKKNARRMLKGENLSPYEFRIVTKDGQIRWIMETVTPIKYDGRDAVLGNSMDITGSKESDDALKIRDELERSIFLSVPHALFGVEQRRIFFANDAMEDVFGWKPEELIGKSTRVIFRNNEEWEEYGVLLYSQLQKLPVFKFESGIPFMRKDGREIFCRMSVSRVGKELGERRRIVATFEDITHLKREEEEKRKLEFQLVQAQKMEAVGTLAGGVAHDFNNLLMTMQGNTSMMLQDLDPSHPHNEYLKSIERQIRSAANLTKQLLGFAREGHYDVKPTDINEVVEKTAFMFGRTKKEITIQRKYGENLWSVDADADQMGQVLMNLFVNSWQAMPAGGNLFLETRNVILDESYVEPYKAVPGRYVKISVTDTGTGMDEKTKQRIFDPFFTTKELGRGTGLGLSMAYGIIRRHKGFVNVYSEPGHGTTFDIYLPASEREAVPEAATSQDIIRGTGTVLLVDDEAQVLKVSRRMLERLGYTVISTQNGKEAVELYQERKDGIDIVLLDMIMPGMSGEKVFQALREMNPAVRVILLSGYSINGQAKSILESGCNGFLQKPVSLRELSQKIDEVLRLKTEE